MIVQVLIKRSDTCGNSDYESYGYFNAPSLEEARKIFKDTPFVGFIVREVKIQELPDCEQRPPREYR